MKDDPLPCPFCGIHVSLDRDNDLMASYISHPDNLIHGPKCPMGSAGAFLAQWNRRAEPAGLSEILNKIRARASNCWTDEADYSSGYHNGVNDACDELEAALANKPSADTK